MATLEHILSQTIDLNMAMTYVNTFFIIISAELFYLLYVLYNEQQINVNIND